MLTRVGIIPQPGQPILSSSILILNNRNSLILFRSVGPFYPPSFATTLYSTRPLSSNECRAFCNGHTNETIVSLHISIFQWNSLTSTNSWQLRGFTCGIKVIKPMVLPPNKIWRDPNKNMRDTSKPAQSFFFFFFFFFFLVNPRGSEYTSLTNCSQSLSSPHYLNITVTNVRNTNLDFYQCSHNYG